MLLLLYKPCFHGQFQLLYFHLWLRRTGLQPLCNLRSQICPRRVRNCPGRGSCSKVRVNVVAPTLTPTEMGTAMVGGEKMLPMIEERHPLKKIPAVNEIASTIAFLHSDAATSITGQILKVDGGLYNSFKFMIAENSASAPVLVWFRKDLRLHDNPALQSLSLQTGRLFPCLSGTPRKAGNGALEPLHDGGYTRH